MALASGIAGSRCSSVITGLVLGSGANTLPLCHCPRLTVDKNVFFLVTTTKVSELALIG